MHDIDSTLAFYNQLGFDLADAVKTPEGEFVWVKVVNADVTIMFQTFSSLGDTQPMVNRSPGGSLLLYISVQGIRAYHEQIRNVISAATDLEKTFYGATEFSVVDNNQYLLVFAEHE